MKKCQQCLSRKPLSEFNKNSSKRDGYQDWCRSCDNGRSREYYEENKERQKKQIGEAKKLRLAKNKEWVCRFLMDHPCVDCGEPDIRVLEFDHLGDKKFHISRGLAEGYGLERIQQEIAKCEVRCANCHNLRTAEVGDHFKHRFWLANG
jgi:hypothetical protein